LPDNPNGSPGVLTMWDLDNLPELSSEFHCYPWVAHEGMTIFGGSGGSGKSFLCLDLAIAIASGQQWLNYPTTPVPILYIFEDGPEVRELNRYRQLTQGRGLAVNAPLLKSNFHFCSPQGVRVDEKQTVDLLIHTLNEVQPKIVFWDALVAIHGQDENSNQFMGDIMRRKLRGLMRAFEFASVIIHHYNKPPAAPKGSQRVTIDRLRGASEIVNSVDIVCQVQPNRLEMIRNQLIPEDDWAAPIMFERAPSKPSGVILRLVEDLHGFRRMGLSVRQIAEATGMSKSEIDRQFNPKTPDLK